METSQNELDNERQMKMEQLSSPLEDNRLTIYTCSNHIHGTFLLLFSSSIVEEHQKYIEQLQGTLFEKDNQRNSLSERLNTLELELQRTVDDHTWKSNEYEESLQSLTQERDALIEQQAIHSKE